MRSKDRDERHTPSNIHVMSVCVPRKELSDLPKPVKPMKDRPNRDLVTLLCPYVGKGIQHRIETSRVMCIACPLAAPKPSEPILLQDGKWAEDARLLDVVQALRS